MGYWAKDGSYQKGELEDQDKITEAQRWESEEQSVAKRNQMEQDQINKEKAEAELRHEIWLADQQKKKKEIEKSKQLEAKKELDALNERRYLINKYRLESTFSLMKDKVTGKAKKFDNLWNQYSLAESIEEKKAIVDQMEKMYPLSKEAFEELESEGKSR